MAISETTSSSKGTTPNHLLICDFYSRHLHLWHSFVCFTTAPVTPKKWGVRTSQCPQRCYNGVATSQIFVSINFTTENVAAQNCAPLQTLWRRFIVDRANPHVPFWTAAKTYVCSSTTKQRKTI